MNSPDVLISLLILAAIAIAAVLARRQGAANPVGTAKLQADVTKLASRVGKIETSITAMRADLDAAPTKEDIARIEGQIGKVGAIGEKTDQAVVRIEQLLMDRALPSIYGRRRG